MTCGRMRQEPPLDRLLTSNDICRLANDSTPYRDNALEPHRTTDGEICPCAALAGLPRKANLALDLSTTASNYQRDDRSPYARPPDTVSISHDRALTAGQVLSSRDGTRKLLLTLNDGMSIEAVLIPDKERLTLCVSTQVGCMLDCGFCLTGRMGLQRNLKLHEIIDQILTAQDLLNSDEQITNLVFMGMESLWPIWTISRQP